MNQRSDPLELPGLEVSVDRIVYRHLPGHERPHSFVYFISIRNRSGVTVTLRQRKWVVTHDDGTQIVVVGDGIVGQTPTLQPGGTFTYNSQHLIATQSAVAEGAYGGVDDSGRAVVTRIPRFELRVPHPDL
jgi:ApaG protein